MIHGNWIALCKSLSIYLPDDRPYTKLEAMYSLTLDIDNKNPISISGYSALWSWSRGKVRRFLSDLEITIDPPQNNEEFALQKGQPHGHPADTLGEKKGHPRVVFKKELYKQDDTLGEKKGHPADTPTDTTINPINPNPKDIYSENSIEFRLSAFLLNNIKKHLPTVKEPNLQNWSKDSDYLLRIDKRNVEEAKQLIRFCHASKSDFFHNVLSMSKFRKRYDEIKISYLKVSNKKNADNTNFSMTV